MQKKTNNDIPFLVFNNLSQHPGLFHAITTRAGGISPAPFDSLNLGLNTEDTPENILRNHQMVSGALAFNLQSLVSTKQVHGSRCLNVTGSPSPADPGSVTYTHEGYDALITDRPGIVLTIRVADCVPILLYDPEAKVVAVVHAGWKGTLVGIAGIAVGQMCRAFGAQEARIRAGIGPSIGPCCFEVGSEVAELFHQAFTGSTNYMTRRAGSTYLDLKQANHAQLVGSGLVPQHIETGDFCTACRSDVFFSHRREQGKTGRFALFAGLGS